MNFKTQIVQTIKINVTPELAKQMLGTSIGNRKLRVWHVDMLAALQQRGEWKLTHQGAAFDSNGALRDAHHRLHACIKSGITVPMLVTTGLDPASFDAVDQGINRTLSDITGIESRVAEPLRLGTSYARKTTRVTSTQVQEIASGGLLTALTNLVAYSGAAKRFYSTAPMKLAAAATIMNGGDSNFVMTQYRALCTLNFDAMSQCAKALVRQVESSKARSNEHRETTARGLRVFDINRSNISKIQVSEADISASIEMVSTLLLESIGEGRPKSLKLFN